MIDVWKIKKDYLFKTTATIKYKISDIDYNHVNNREANFNIPIRRMMLTTP